MRSPSEGPMVVEFITAFCRAKGERVELLDWQRELLHDLFALDENGRWRYRQAYIQLGRKNGKTWVMAMAALYVAVTGPHDSEVYFCAGSRDQASRAFGMIVKAIEDEPTLSALFTGERRPQKHVLEIPGTRTILRVLSADAGLALGLEPSFVIADEVAVWPDDKLWAAMTTGSATREQAMIVGISTPGWRHDSIARKLYEEGRRVQAGEIESPRYLFRCWEPSSPDADYRDPAVWRQANPSLGAFLHEDALAAELDAVHELDFRRFHLGQWVASTASLIDPSAWDACAGEPEIPDGAEGVVIGVDASITRDSTAVVTVLPKDGVFHVAFEVWTPTTAHPIDLTEIESAVRRQAARFTRPLIAYDAMFFHQAAQNLAHEGLRAVEIPQQSAFMVPATQKLIAAVNAGALRHGGDPIARLHAMNAGARETERGVTIAKTRSSGHIDAIVALAMALEAAIRSPRRRSRYEDEDAGVLVI